MRYPPFPAAFTRAKIPIMLTVSAAQAEVLKHARPCLPTMLQMADALGLVLAEDVASDLDIPPFNKAMMDGYAVRLADLPGGHGTLSVVEEITAGKMPTKVLGPGQVARIMTGAPIPQGTDAVVQVERTQLAQTDYVIINDPTIKAGQNVQPLGQVMQVGQIVLRTGTLLQPQDIGILATVGRAAVKVIRRPTVAVLATGDELVEAGVTPGPGQIRNGNGPTLVAQAVRAGAEAIYLGIARDSSDSLQPLIEKGLLCDMLVLAGGVSAGKLDLVPGVLRELGVEAHFHKVEMKPGKPVFFGTRDRTLVFGLPGNPVGAFVTFELFVRMAIRVMRGLADPGPTMPGVALAEDLTYRTDRPTYHPALVKLTDAGWSVKTVPWLGSPDLRGLTGCNCFVLLPAGDHHHRAGQLFPVLRMTHHD